MTRRAVPQHLDGCLAYAVLCEPHRWLGSSSPEALAIFLAGAGMRADLVRAEISRWRIDGPLDLPDFYFPLVARTGHPRLTIKWATALELLYFDLDEAIRQLRFLVEAWPAPRPGALHPPDLQPPAPLEPDLRTHLRRLARRPGMYLGTPSGRMLGHFLAGMKRGGDWLQLPPLPDLDSILSGIEAHSASSYGSIFAAFRVHDHDPAELLSWVGVLPSED